MLTTPNPRELRRPMTESASLTMGTDRRKNLRSISPLIPIVARRSRSGGGAGIRLKQHREKHIARSGNIIGERLVEFLGILIRLEKHDIEHDGFGAGLLEVPHHIATWRIARPRPVAKRFETRLIDGEQQDIGIGFGRFCIPADEVIQRFEFC
ncbi:MAG: hypothetical protein U0361_19105 [Nitrospiraceae bacterium]